VARQGRNLKRLKESTEKNTRSEKKGQVGGRSRGQSYSKQNSCQEKKKNEGATFLGRGSVVESGRRARGKQTGRRTSKAINQEPKGVTHKDL